MRCNAGSTLYYRLHADSYIHINARLTSDIPIGLKLMEIRGTHELKEPFGTLKAKFSSQKGTFLQKI